MWCIIGEGEFDYYMFQPDEDELPDPRIMDDPTLRFFMDASFESESPPESPPVIPRSPRSGLGMNRGKNKNNKHIQ